LIPIAKRIGILQVIFPAAFGEEINIIPSWYPAACTGEIH